LLNSASGRLSRAEEVEGDSERGGDRLRQSPVLDAQGPDNQGMAFLSPLFVAGGILGLACELEMRDQSHAISSRKGCRQSTNRSTLNIKA
jgi:hypothetical protein